MKVKAGGLSRAGLQVSYNGSTFSIFHNGPVIFRTEDPLIENSVFEWQQYKKDRMMERVELAQLRDNLKGGASLKNADGKEN